ncbi:YqaA family protein [Belliella buryatensis]|nr:VTT domain-containing protein [Belliella buryatensis]
MFRGFILLAILILLFYLLRESMDESERLSRFGPIYNNTPLVLLIYIGSEILFGIIPPEVFMLWSLETGHIGPYFLSIGMLATISYAAGYFNFSLGSLLKEKLNLEKVKNKYVQKYLLLLQKFGAYLVIVASISPLPFSAIALMAGAGGMSRMKYTLYSLLRILRYFAYAYVLWLVEG